MLKMPFSRVSHDTAMTNPGRRSLFTKVLFGGAAVALTPVLGSIPGVSAASFGFKGLENMRLLPLVGAGLKREQGAFSSLPQHKVSQHFLSTKGFTSITLSEGYQIFTQVGDIWRSQTILIYEYKNNKNSERAQISYLKDSNSVQVEAVIISGDASNLVATGYKIDTKQATLTGSITRTASSLITVSPQGEVKTKSLASHTVAGRNSIKPESFACNACNGICDTVVATGCSILGALLECAGVCAPFGEFPACDGICVAVFVAVCAGTGTFDCANFCTSQFGC
jgi:hypothetical protein